MKNPPTYSVAKLNEFDNRTSSDLAAESFSGIRTNDLMARFELWIVGHLDRTLSYQRFWDEPYSLEAMYCEAFGLKEVTLEGAVKEAMREISARKQEILLLGSTDEGKRTLDES